MASLNMKSFALFSLAAAGTITAHPGDHLVHEAQKRAIELSSLSYRSLGHCADKLAVRGHSARTIQRRQNTLNDLLSRKLVQRDLDTVLNTSHHSNLTVGPESPFSDVFLDSNLNASCILAPEATQGPYFVSGEYFRSNVTEDQIGVPLVLDVQLIDSRTCEPLSGAAIDLWHANATGVYSGYPDGEGGLNTTWLRGIQATDDDGALQFQTIFPGHYTGRATHIHLLTHSPGNWTLLPNNTITGDKWSPHIGQVFFDQTLISAVEELAPYTSNTQELTTNADDIILAQEVDKADGDIDPVADYVYLGDNVSDGIFSWISIAIDPSSSFYVPAAVEHYKDYDYVDPCFTMIHLPDGFVWSETVSASCSTQEYARRTAPLTAPAGIITPA